MNSVLRTLTAIVIVGALLVGQWGPRVFASPGPLIAADTTDREALVALYQAVNGNDWLNNDNWLTDAPIGAWHGVVADTSGRVISLDLRENGLRGSLAAELGSLSKLNSLNLSGNELNGSIPSELGNLSTLVWLDLAGNELSGSLPPTLGSLTKLFVLDLSRNQLSGPIPSALGAFTDLTVLDLSRNRMSGAIPSALGNTNLKQLNFSENNLEGEIPPELGALVNLALLNLSGNRLGGCVPEALRDVEENDLDGLGLPFCTAPTPTATAVPQILSTAQIFRNISPSITFVETDISSGSGVLFEGGYVVTNAHVVWPYNEATIVFPDGEEFRRVEVIGWDLLTDLAVLGPIDAPVGHVELLDGEDVAIGSDMYLIGYPGGGELQPQPAIVRGILSRLREWEAVGVTYFQTDATAVGGQSGGALVSETGDVIGISGFRITEGSFGLVASAADLLPRIRQLSAGEDPSGLGDRRLPLRGGGKRHHDLTPQSYLDAYIVNEPADTEIEFELGGESDTGVLVYDSFGEEPRGAGRGSFVTEIDGPHFLIVPEKVSGEATLTANHPLRRFVDPDRDRPIEAGESLHGNIDFPGDIDTYVLQLEKDEKATIVVRSILADPMLTVSYAGATEEQQVTDDDSGGGLFRQDAAIEYKASHTGQYTLIVESTSWRAPGGYVITVDSDRTRRAPTPLAPKLWIKRLVEVRQGPGANYPISGAAVPGEQYIITGKDAAGNWWQIEYEGQPGWVAAELMTATNAKEVEVVSGLLATRSVPVVSVHNPLVIPIGDTPAVSGGAYHGWIAYEDGAHGLKVFYPPDWHFASAKEELPSLMSQMGDQSIAEALVKAQTTYIDSLTAAGEEERFVGMGFRFDAEAARGYVNGFDVLAVPAEGRSLEEFAQLLNDRLEESGSATMERVEVGSGLRPWREQVASIRYRSGGVLVFDDTAVTAPGGEVAGWKVVLLSPDGETFLVVTFDVWGEDFARLEPLLRGIVRQVEWVNQPAYEPPVGPTISISRTMNIRGGPGTNYAIVGSGTAGQQFAAITMNAAGDWWQIVYEGQLAWVYAPFVTQSEDTAERTKVDVSGWQTYEDDAGGLALSYPPGWHFFDPAQPSQADLTLLSAAKEGDGELLAVAETADMVSAMSVGREDALIGLGLQTVLPGADEVPGNFMLVYSFAADGLTPDRYSQMAADLLQRRLGVEADRVELMRGLRALSDEAVSIRYREDVTASEVWQVWLLSPDGETLLALVFSVRGDEFAELEPLLSEIVQRVQWTGQPKGAVATSQRDLNVHSGPGLEYPAIGTAAAGQQFRIVGKDSDDSWWQIAYEGQRGWVFGEHVTAADDENVPVATDIPPPPPPPTDPVVTIDRNMNVRAGPGTFYPVLGTASPGDKYFITGQNRSGSWWRINFNDESGWIFSNLVTADGPLEDVPIIESFDWDAYYDSNRRLWIFYPPGWFFFNPAQPSDADRRSLIDLLGRESAEEMLSDFAADIDSDERETFVGFGFKILPDYAERMFATAFPSEGFDLRRLMSIVTESMREAGLDVDSAEVVTNLRYDGSETVSIRYRDNREGLGSGEIYWQVWLLSPDRGTLLRFTFIYESAGSSQSVPLISEIVRRIRWE